MWSSIERIFYNYFYLNRKNNVTYEFLDFCLNYHIIINRNILFENVYDILTTHYKNYYITFQSIIKDFMHNLTELSYYIQFKDLIQYYHTIINRNNVNYLIPILIIEILIIEQIKLKKWNYKILIQFIADSEYFISNYQLDYIKSDFENIKYEK